MPGHDVIAFAAAQQEVGQVLHAVHPVVAHQLLAQVRAVQLPGQLRVEDDDRKGGLRQCVGGDEARRVGREEHHDGIKPGRLELRNGAPHLLLARAYVNRLHGAEGGEGLRDGVHQLALFAPEFGSALVVQLKDKRQQPDLRLYAVGHRVVSPASPGQPDTRSTTAAGRL